MSPLVLSCKFSFSEFNSLHWFFFYSLRLSLHAQMMNFVGLQLFETSRTVIVLIVIDNDCNVLRFSLPWKIQVPERIC